MRKLNISDVFKTEAENLTKIRLDAIRIHGTGDIKAAGNEIEEQVRVNFRRMFPKNLYVTHGHLVDEKGLVSPQLDIIIADIKNLPSLITTKDGTEYIPIESVYAFGEIKSTYQKRKKHLEGFSAVISRIKSEMTHREITNTAYKGKLTDSTLLRDIFLSKNNRILNRLFSFVLFIDSGDFDFADTKTALYSFDKRYLPNVCTLLNAGSIIYGRSDGSKFVHERYPEENDEDGYLWHFVPLHPTTEFGTLEGNTLSSLYFMILEHINNSFLETPNLGKYLTGMVTSRKSLIQS